MHIASRLRAPLLTSCHHHYTSDACVRSSVRIADKCWEMRDIEMRWSGSTRAILRLSFSCLYWGTGWRQGFDTFVWRCLAMHWLPWCSSQQLEGSQSWSKGLPSAYFVNADLQVIRFACGHKPGLLFRIVLAVEVCYFKQASKAPTHRSASPTARAMQASKKRLSAQAHRQKAEGMQAGKKLSAQARDHNLKPCKRLEAPKHPIPAQAPKSIEAPESDRCGGIEAQSDDAVGEGFKARSTCLLPLVHILLLLDCYHFGPARAL